MASPSAPIRERLEVQLLIFGFGILSTDPKNSRMPGGDTVLIFGIIKRRALAEIDFTEKCAPLFGGKNN